MNALNQSVELESVAADPILTAHALFKAGLIDALEFGKRVDEACLLKQAQPFVAAATSPAPDMASMFAMFAQLLQQQPMPTPAPEKPPESLTHPGELRTKDPHNLLKDIIEAYLAQYSGKDQTRYSRCQVWADRIGHLSLAELNRAIVRDTLKQIASEPAKKFAGRNHLGEAVFRAAKGGISGPTQNRLVAALYAALAWAQDEDVEYAPDDWVIPRVKMKQESQPRDRCLTEEETQQLLTAAQESSWPMMHLLIWIATTTGARRGEISTMRWEDVDLDQRTVTFPTTKNNKPRTVPLLREICDELKHYAKQTGYVFTGTRKKNQPFSFEAQWQQALKRAKLKGVVFHSLRHSAITKMIEGGVPTLTVQQLVGHSSSHMTSRYTHISSAVMADAVSRVFGGNDADD